MEQSTRNTAPPAGQREMMFCHECHDEWYRDEKGIICPECDSEFTEVIEDGNDPRDNFEHGHEDDFDDDSLPSLEEAPPNLHPLHNHNPWRDDDDDPEEADISSMRFQPTGPGRFHVQATISRTISPTQLFGGGGNELNPMGAFQSFLTNMIQGAQPQDQEHDLGGDGQSESRPAGRGMPQVHRFTYSSNGDLHPREDGRPGPRPEPVDDINSVMTGLFAMLGEPIGGGRAGPGPAHAFGGMPPTLTNFFAAINGGQHGDAVYSQEALDRIVSQLMEQTASGNAPGPAPEQAINALPRKPVSEEMLGAEHRAECSICMDEVNIGEEVTELPCKHWFHHPCISAWLSEHDTCPHCRKSIRKEGDESSGNGPSSTSANATTSGADPTTAMPGAFGAAGEGTINNPFILSSRAANSNANSSTNAQGGASEQSNSGLGGRIRRGLFGP